MRISLNRRPARRLPYYCIATNTAACILFLLLIICQVLKSHRSSSPSNRSISSLDPIGSLANHGQSRFETALPLTQVQDGQPKKTLLTSGSINEIGIYRRVSE